MASLLAEQRRKEAEVYKNLKVRVDRGVKISALTQEEIVQLEDLFQLAENGELASHNKTADIEFLMVEKAKRTKKRLAENKPPFEKTLFDRWDWDTINRKYVWKVEEGDNPQDYNSEGFSWEPREITPPASHPEQEKTL